MIVGVGFKNTVVCYDQLFHSAASDEKPVPAGLLKSKTAVRDYIRTADRESDWTNPDNSYCEQPEFRRVSDWSELFPLIESGI